MLLGTLGASLLGNLLAGKGIVRLVLEIKKEKEFKSWLRKQQRKRNCKSWHWKTMEFLMPPHPLTNFEIQRYYQNEPRFNGVFSRNNLPLKIKGWVYVINLGEYADVGIHWIALFCNRSEIVYFNSFGVEHVLEEIKIFVGNKNLKANIFRVQANNSVICGYFCSGFIDFMLAGKKLTDYTCLFSPYGFEKNNVIILSYFKDE